MTRIRTVVAAVLVGLTLTVFAAAPAAAQAAQAARAGQADKLKLMVAGDGAEGVTIQATYPDGRRLDRVVRLILTATGPDGQEIGPVQLEPQPEGQGFYSSGPVLTAGTWKVTVNSPAPLPGEATATVQARAAQSPPPPEPVAVTRTADGAGGTGWWPYAAAGLVVVALAMGVAMLFGRRRTTI